MNDVSARSGRPFVVSAGYITLVRVGRSVFYSLAFRVALGESHTFDVTCIGSHADVPGGAKRDGAT